jgi:hypothetical protein
LTFVALVAIYPEHNWKSLQFKSSHSKYHWASLENQRKFFEEFASEYGIKEQSDWYLVRYKDIRKKLGGSAVLRYYNNSLVRALAAIYPNYPWKTWDIREPHHSGLLFDGNSPLKDWNELSRRYREGSMGKLLFKEVKGSTAHHKV